MLTDQQRAIRYTNWLLEAWDPLHESRLKGTHRPWKQTDLTPQQQAHLDAEARAEKQDRGAFCLGESPAPIHLDILDRLQDIATTTHQLAATLAQATHDDVALVHLRRARDHQAPHLLEYVRHILASLNQEDPNDGDLLADTATTLARLRTDTASHFAEVVEGQRLKADCPWCGKEKLRFRLIGPEHRQELVIRCESGTCEPPSEDCGAYHHNKPCWPIHEWEWLAGRINHHNDQARTKTA